MLLSISVSFSLFSQSRVVASSQDSVAVKERPRVGLVLSGGGAKGAAHIGVIKYIEEAGIPIDFKYGFYCWRYACFGLFFK